MFENILPNEQKQIDHMKDCMNYYTAHGFEWELCRKNLGKLCDTIRARDKSDELLTKKKIHDQARVIDI